MSIPERMSRCSVKAAANLLCSEGATLGKRRRSFTPLVLSLSFRDPWFRR